ncbi:MAG: hypothetical protein JNK87_40610 [Bryobacterales bacterium]|nr:hypothetical protein [Bryobacterales bacterium]
MQLLIVLLSIATLAWSAEPTGILPAKWHPANFPDPDDSFNGVTAASDGRIYYALGSREITIGAQFYVYDPATAQTRNLGDLTEAAGEKGQKAVPQGKVHVNFHEHKGKLYFATHAGYSGAPPSGYQPYPGGHFLSYDLVTGRFESLAVMPKRESVVTMTMDTKQGILYGLTSPSAHLIAYDLGSKQTRDLGPTSEPGRGVCRAMGVDQFGGVLFTTSTGDIWRYGGKTPGLVKLAASSLKRDVLGQWDPTKPGSMAYHWRQLVWAPGARVFYGVHGTSGYLFRFNPYSEQLDIVERIASEKSRRLGLYDTFAFGYLGLTLGPDGHTLYYLTGTPLGEEIRFITYDTQNGKYTDHGAVALDDGTRPFFAQSIAMGRDKRVYFLSKARENGKVRAGLMSFPDPLQTAPPPAPRFRQIIRWTNPTGMPHPLREAHNSAIDRDGNVILTDSIGARVQRFTREGKWLNEIGGGPGAGPGQFAGPRESRVNMNTGEIFVADSDNHRIQVFDHTGKYLRKFGSEGRGPGQMLRVHGLVFSPDYKRLYAADVDNDRIMVFDPSGRHLFSFGTRGERPGQLRDAHGLGIDTDGNIYVSNYFGPVSKFDSDGKFLYEYGESGHHGWTHYHHGMADRQGTMFLAGRTVTNRNGIVVYDHRGAYVTSLPVLGDGGAELSIKSIDAAADGRIYVTIESRDLHGLAVYVREE